MGSTFDEMLNALEAELSELADLSSRFTRSFEQYTSTIWDNLTEQGSLTLPGQQLLKSTFASSPPKELPPPPPSFLSRLSNRVSNRPWMYASLAAGIPLAAVLFYNRHALAQLKAVKTARPRPLTHNGHRAEACLVIGAEPGSLAEALCIDLVQRGFVVIAIVSRPESVEGLARLGQGYVRAICLDEEDPMSITSCLKALSTALSLRYPLHSPGDPYHSGRQLALTAVINCLALFDTFQPVGLPMPLEAIPARDFSRSLSDRLATVLALLQGALPLLRNSTNSALAGTTASVVTVVPAASARINLPFVGGKSAADAALLSLMESVQRETQCATVGLEKGRSIRFVTLEVGAEATSRSHSRAHRTVDLPRHLQFYSASISRRAIRATHPGRLLQRSSIRDALVKLVLGKGYSRRTSSGPGVFTYRLMSLLPSPVIDLFFSAQDHVAPRIKPSRPAEFDRPMESPSSQPNHHDDSASSQASGSSFPSVPSSNEGQLPQDSDMTASITSFASGSGVAGEWQELGASETEA